MEFHILASSIDDFHILTVHISSSNKADICYFITLLHKTIQNKSNQLHFSKTNNMCACVCVIERYADRAHLECGVFTSVSIKCEISFVPHQFNTKINIP